MTKSGLALPLSAVVLASLLGGCGGAEVASGSGAAATAGVVGPASGTGSPSPLTDGASSSSGIINRTATPAISGTPQVKAIAGQNYSFQPQLANASSAGTSFSVEHPPAWARFDASTGKLSGTPAANQLGTYPNIVISALVGRTAVTLPPFSITVTADSAANSSASVVTLSWEVPEQNADGTPLVDLKGFKVHYGTSSHSYSDTIQVANAGLTTYVVQNLAAGHYYFAVTAYNSTGMESGLSPEVSTQVVD